MEATAILTLASERLMLSDACEQTAGADYFVTADDKLLRRAKSLPNLIVTPISLLGLVSEIPQ